MIWFILLSLGAVFVAAARRTPVPPDPLPPEERDLLAATGFAIIPPAEVEPPEPDAKPLEPRLPPGAPKLRDRDKRKPVLVKFEQTGVLRTEIGPEIAEKWVLLAKLGPQDKGKLKVFLAISVNHSAGVGWDGKTCWLEEIDVGWRPPLEKRPGEVWYTWRGKTQIAWEGQFQADELRPLQRFEDIDEEWAPNPLALWGEPASEVIEYKRYRSRENMMYRHDGKIKRFPRGFTPDGSLFVGTSGDVGVPGNFLQLRIWVPSLPSYAKKYCYPAEFQPTKYKWEVRGWLEVERE